MTTHQTLSTIECPALRFIEEQSMNKPNILSTTSSPGDEAYDSSAGTEGESSNASNPTAIACPNPIALLRFATSTQFEEPQAHFVQAPVSPGPQACLVELKELHGTVRLVDTVTVVPTHVPFQVIEHPVYAAYLRLIAKTYKATITKVANQSDVMALAQKRYDQPPFACAAQTELRQQIFKALEAAGLTNLQQVNELVGNAASDCMWHPQHLSQGKTANRHRSWLILARWEDWETRDLPWNKRFDEHCKDRKYNLQKNYSQAKTAFRKMCGHLGLKKRDLSVYKRLHTSFASRGMIRF